MNAAAANYISMVEKKAEFPKVLTVELL